MEYALIAAVTLFGAGLTLFSGFGLGTLLMPVFAIFFPIDLAIAMTAIVHFANNLIKMGFFYRHINWKIALRFGIPSIVAAFFGAWLLTRLTGMEALFSYEAFGRTLSVMPVKLTVALLLIIFALFELIPRLSNLHFDQKFMPVGGLLSGFFGGLSGNQGALRSAFLIRAGLTKEAFIATGIVIACLIDITRLSIYSGSTFSQIDRSRILLLVIAIASAFTGVLIGNRLLKKITVKALQVIVAVMLLVFSALLGSGVL
jgi:hypothetical protein